jgi:hypothetical protein
MTTTKIDLRLDPSRTEMGLTIARGDRVRQVTSMTLTATEVDDLITALTQMRERMLPQLLHQREERGNLS